MGTALHIIISKQMSLVPRALVTKVNNSKRQSLASWFAFTLKQRKRHRTQSFCVLRLLHCFNMKGKLTGELITKLRSYYGWALKLHKGDVKAMHKAVMATYYRSIDPFHVYKQAARAS